MVRLFSDSLVDLPSHKKQPGSIKTVARSAIAIIYLTSEQDVCSLGEHFATSH